MIPGNDWENPVAEGGVKSRKRTQRRALTVGGESCQSTPNATFQRGGPATQASESSLTSQLYLVGCHSGSITEVSECEQRTHRAGDIRKRTVDQLGDLVP